MSQERIPPEFVVQRQGKNVILYAGLLHLAHEQGLKSIRTTLLQVPSPENGHVAICQAIVETEKGTFSGIGDASPDNVTRQILPHSIRLAETRAKARALRDAVNIGMVALEELGTEDEPPAPQPTPSELSEGEKLQVWFDRIRQCSTAAKLDEVERSYTNKRTAMSERLRNEIAAALAFQKEKLQEGF